jgi:hypothetical protein
LFDDETAKIRIDQTLPCTFNGSDKAGVGNAIPVRPLCKSFGFENT